MSVDSHLIANKVGLDNLGFNVEEPKELLPRCLINGADHEVGTNTKNLLIRKSMLLFVPRSPAKLQGKTSKKASFSRAHCTSSSVVLSSVSRFWSIPHSGNHIDNLIVKLNRCRIDRSVGNVDLGTHGCDGLFLWFARHVDIGRGVEKGIEIAEMDIFNHRSNMLGRHTTDRNSIEVVSDTCIGRGGVCGVEGFAVLDSVSKHLHKITCVGELLLESGYLSSLIRRSCVRCGCVRCS
mmetsp:Transcript_7385/g.11245  ORF Transcript_7385/g.11245 Transcript_7385/m.11245 type:complete len:237 (-) Transcript_7385:285-995(-)